MSILLVDHWNTLWNAIIGDVKCQKRTMHNVQHSDTLEQKMEYAVDLTYYSGRYKKCDQGTILGRADITHLP